MKNVFFCALLVNIVYFLWQYQQGALALHLNAPVKTKQNTEKQILLLSELKLTDSDKSIPSEKPENLEKTEKEKNDKVNEIAISLNIDTSEDEKNKTQVIEALNKEKKKLCYQIGVFSHQDAIDKWSDKLGIDSALLQVYQQNKAIISDYLVYYPAETTFKESQKNLKMLQALGIKDAWLFEKGEFKGDIALGTFKTKKQALKLQKEFFTKSILAAIKPRYKIPPNFYVKLKTDKNQQQLQSVLQGLVKKISIEQLKECDLPV